MTHRKNGFWNLCFSVIPGAGQMYQGFMKRGASIMTLFFGLITICTFFGIDECLLFVPVIWFFGFFDSLHRNSLSDAERELLKDEFIFIRRDEIENFSLRKFRIPVAILLMFFGAYNLLKLAVDQLIGAGFLFWGDEIVSMVYDRLPKMVFSFIIILLGVYLIIGRKKEIMDREEDENLPWMEHYHSEESVQEQPDSNMQEGEEREEVADVQPKEEREEVVDVQPEEERNEDGGEQV